MHVRLTAALAHLNDVKLHDWGCAYGTFVLVFSAKAFFGSITHHILFIEWLRYDSLNIMTSDVLGRKDSIPVTLLYQLSSLDYIQERRISSWPCFPFCSFLNSAVEFKESHASCVIAQIERIYHHNLYICCQKLVQKGCTLHACEPPGHGVKPSKNKLPLPPQPTT